MKTLLFELTMPRNGSWNGQWTGAKNIYARKRRVSEEVAKRVMADATSHPIYEGIFSPKLIGQSELEASFGYDFGDGWYANIKVTQVPAKVANSVVKKSVGFYGYDWMIDSIILHDEIKLSK